MAANTILLMRKWTYACSFLRSWQIASPTKQRAICHVYLIKRTAKILKKATKAAYDVLREYLKEEKLTKCNLFYQKKSLHLLWENFTLNRSDEKEWWALHQKFTCRDTLWPSAVLQFTQDWYHQRPWVFWSQCSLSSGNEKLTPYTNNQSTKMTPRNCM